MIVEDLQGPIYLGQDIFQATHIFHSLTPTHMIMSIGRHTYRTPYIQSRRDRPIAHLQASDGSDKENPHVAINHTQEQSDNDILFQNQQSETIPPNGRFQVKIKFSVKSPMKIQLPCIAELHPVNLPDSDCPEVVPTLNQLSVEGQTEIMVVNNREHEVSIKAGTTLATAKISDIIRTNK